MNKELKDMTNEELLEEYRTYDTLIYGEECCYGKRDLYYFEEIQREISRREEG